MSRLIGITSERERERERVAIVIVIANANVVMICWAQITIWDWMP